MTGTPIPDREIWACALHVERTHGIEAPLFVAGRIGALALRGDMEGVRTWKRIAKRLDELGRSLTASQTERPVER